jgi:hypothetical protein
MVISSPCSPHLSPLPARERDRVGGLNPIVFRLSFL